MTAIGNDTNAQADMNDAHRAALRLSGALSDPDWRPSRSHLEGARNELTRASGEIERLRASLRGALDASAHRAYAPAWQPAETAPKDGTKIDGWFVLPNPGGANRWTSVSWVDSLGGGYWSGGPPSQYEGGWHLTHWMPRPAAPGDTDQPTNVMPWRTMESAPRDGTEILWHAGDEERRASWYVISWPQYSECFDQGYWQPLPAPPPMQTSGERMREGD
jgi:hypothetical protein